MTDFTILNRKTGETFHVSAESAEDALVHVGFRAGDTRGEDATVRVLADKRERAA